MMKARAVAGIWIVAVFPGMAFAQIRPQLHFTPISNLVYQLDCISGELPHCSRKTYQDLWDKTFIRTDHDRSKIKTWGDLMNRYRTEVGPKTVKRRTQLSSKIRIASIENYSVAEFLSSEKPVDRLDVVIHELCHFLYESAAEDKQATLKGRFQDEGKLTSRSAYHLLNESIATALGNGLINQLIMKKERWQKFLAKERSFYNDGYIDRAAKAILPWIGSWVSEGKTIYDPDFSKKYLSSLEQALAHELTAPRLLLNELVLIADGRYGGKFRDSVKRALRASSMYTSEGNWSDSRLLEPFHQNTALSALFVVHPSNLNQLKEKGILSKIDSDRLKKEVETNQLVIFPFERFPSIPAYVLVAPDYEQALNLVETLAKLK